MSHVINANLNVCFPFFPFDYVLVVSDCSSKWPTWLLQSHCFLVLTKMCEVCWDRVRHLIFFYILCWFLYFILYRMYNESHDRPFQSNTGDLESCTCMVRLQELSFDIFKVNRGVGSLNHFDRWMNKTFCAVCIVFSPKMF